MSLLLRRFVESTNVSVAAAVVANSVMERVRATRKDASPSRFYLHPNEQAELYHQFLKPLQPEPNLKIFGKMRSKFDVTRLGATLETQILRHGMFVETSADVALENSPEKHIDFDLAAYMDEKFHFSAEVGRSVSRYFARRTQIGALSDKVGSHGFETRCKALVDSLAGLGALTCESALCFGDGGDFAGIRRKLLPIFENTISAVNKDYSMVFDSSGFPSVPFYSQESINSFQHLRDQCMIHAWNEMLAFCSTQMSVSREVLLTLVDHASCEDISNIICRTIRCNSVAAQHYGNFSRQAHRTFPELESILRSREPLRDVFVDKSLTKSEAIGAVLTEEELSLLQILVRLAQCADIVSSLHTCAWEKEKGLGSKRVQSIRYGLLESILTLGHCEMKQLQAPNEIKLSRGIYEWMGILCKLRRVLSEENKNSSVVLEGTLHSR